MSSHSSCCRPPFHHESNRGERVRWWRAEAEGSPGTQRHPLGPGVLGVWSEGWPRAAAFPPGTGSLSRVQQWVRSRVFGSHCQYVCMSGWSVKEMRVHWPSVINRTVPQPLMRAFQWTIVEAVRADDDLFLLVLPLRYCVATGRCTSDIFTREQVNLIMWLDVYGLCQCLNNIHAYKVNQSTISLTFRQTG